MLSVPSCGRSMTSVGRMCPYATTTEMSGASARSCAMNSSPRGRSGWNTGSDSSSAICLTGGASSFERERPTGLSGCVTTPTTSKPSPISARSGGTANSGVPQKSTRTQSSSSGCSCDRDGSVSSLSNEARILVLLLRPLRQRRASLENAQVVDEQLAVQMIDLVLQAAREQVRRLRPRTSLPSRSIARTRTFAGRSTSP